MKKLVVLLFFMPYVACNKFDTAKGPQSTAIVVIKDITENMALIPGDDILQEFGFADNPDQQASLKISLITDRVLNPTETVHLFSKENTKHHPHTAQWRQEQIASFFRDCKAGLLDFGNEFIDGQPMNNSEVYATIAFELSLLAKNKSARRELFIYSDLNEKSSFNSYSEDGKQLLATNTPEVVRIFKSIRPFPKKLKGISIHFKYQPPNREAEKRYFELLACYQALLAETGADVIVELNNKNFEL